MEADGTVNAGQSTPRPAQDRRAGRRDLLILALAGLALFFWRLGSRDLWPADEPRFALMAREMWDRGDYVVPFLNNEVHTDKPPLYFWAINGFGRLLGGIDELAARLPSALSGLLALFLIYLMATRLYDRRTGLLGALVFATSLQIAIRARWASIDMTLNLFVLAAILLLWTGREGGERSRAAVLWAWILMGLATLAKGPVGLVMPLLAVLPAILVERDWAAARRLVAPMGVLLYLAVCLAWFGPYAGRLGAGSALGVLVHETLHRYADAWNSQHPVGYYLWRFPAGFLPWTLLLPWAVTQALAPEEREQRRSALFLMIWAAAIILFFSFSTGKRGVYIIPAYPAASILVARLLSRGSWDLVPGAAGAAEEIAAARRRLRLPLLLWLSLAALIAAGLPIAAVRAQPDLLAPAVVIGAVILAGAAAALVLHRRDRAAAATLCLIGSTAAAIVLTVELAQPSLNRYKNIRGFAMQVKSRLPAGARFGVSESKAEAWIFYTGRFAEILETPESVRSFMERGGPARLLVEDAVMRQVYQPAPAGWETILRGRVGDQEYTLLARGPAP
jgi:4-amino-4-deoxy-L-arabinose transferase-like glycosyltransferase